MENLENGVTLLFLGVVLYVVTVTFIFHRRNPGAPLKAPLAVASIIGCVLLLAGLGLIFLWNFGSQQKIPSEKSEGSSARVYFRDARFESGTDNYKYRTSYLDDGDTFHVFSKK